MQMRFRTVLEVATTLLLVCGLQAGSQPAPARLIACISGLEYAGGEQTRRQNGTQTGGARKGTQNGGKQDSHGNSEKIDKYKAMLAKVGPEARVERETAVESLSALPDLEAHAVLYKYVVPGEDPDGVRKLVLERLPARLGNENDKVFGPQGANRKLIRRSYVAPLVKHFSGDLVPVELEPKARMLRSLARRSLVVMDTGELRDTLTVLSTVKSIAIRRQSLRAAGQCQDLGLAQLVATMLEDTELRSVAREALYDLTYTDFANAASFARWYAANSKKQYVDLAEEAARRAKKELLSREAELSREKIAVVVEFMDVLATSNRKDKWKRIQAQVFPKTPSASTEAANEVQRACLTRLREVLASTPPVQRGADATDRLAFFDLLVKRLDEKPGAVDHALLLEVASYVCAASETPQRTGQNKRLLEGLGTASPLVTRGALRGIRRFFDAPNRRAVLAVTQGARASGDIETLTVAVETLQSTGWSAPSPGDVDLKPWIDGMHAILTDAKMPIALRKHVIPVLCLSDAKGLKLARSFELLLEEVGRQDAHVEVRQSVMLRLPGLIPTEAGPRDLAAAKYLRKLVALQTDKETVAIRRAAANLLTIPPNVSPDNQKVLGTDLTNDVGSRLLEEKDESVFVALVTSLTSLTTIDGLVSAVNTRLRKALEDFGRKEETKTLAEAVVKGLKEVAVTKGRTTSEWTATCESLLTEVRDRRSIRNILDFHLRDTKGPEDETWKHRVWRLVIKTARLAPDGLVWKDTKNRGEAAMVIQAFKVLLADGVYTIATKDEPSLDTTASRLTYLRCLAAVGKPEVLTAQAELWLKPEDKVLVAQDRSEAQLLLAGGYLADSKPVEAWTKSGMQTVTGALLATRLELQTGIAATMRSQKNLKGAVEVLADAVARTKQDAPEYWLRLKSHIEVRFEIDAKAGEGLVKELDDWAKAAKLTADQQKEVATLKATLQGSAKPSK